MSYDDLVNYDDGGYPQYSDTSGYDGDDGYEGFGDADDFGSGDEDGDELGTVGRLADFDDEEETFELTTNFADRERYGGASKSTARTAQGRAIEKFRSTLDAPPFGNTSDNVRTEALNLIQDMPEIETRNPKLLVSAVLWTLTVSAGKKDLPEKFATFAKKYSLNELEQIDLVRYIRIISRPPFLFQKASKTLLQEIEA